jgi:hypothetical protein
MKRIAIFVLLLSLLVVGCSRASLVGKWSINGKDDGDFLEFMSNGTWEYSELRPRGRLIHTGTYTVDKNTLTIKDGKDRFEVKASENEPASVKESNEYVNDRPTVAQFSIPDQDPNMMSISGWMYGRPMMRRVK